MIEFRNFIYLDVYRTGSTHVLDALRQISEEPEMRAWRHSPISRGGPLVRPGRKLVFATVRNPWDWYVSLWAHGAGGKSAIRRYLLQKLPKKEVKTFYDNDEPAPSFRRWLAAIHNPNFAQEFLSEGYPRSGLPPVMGLYTYRFQRVTTWYPSIFLRRWQIRRSEDIGKFHQKRKAYQMILHTENLTADLVELVKNKADECRFKPEAETMIRKADKERKNASDRRLATYRDYYDEEARELVATRDRFFVDTFGYTF